MEPLRISARLRDLVSETFRLGLSLAAGSEQLYPLVAEVESGILQHKVFVDRACRDHRRLAEAHIAALPAHVPMYAYLHEEKAPINGRETHVLIVEAEERGMDASVRFVQPYSPKGFLRAFRALGPPYQAGFGRRRLGKTG